MADGLSQVPRLDRRTLICAIPVVVTPNGAAPPDPDVLRAALRKKLNQGANAGEPDEDEARASPG